MSDRTGNRRINKQTASVVEVIFPKLWLVPSAVYRSLKQYIYIYMYISQCHQTADTCVLLYTHESSRERMANNCRLLKQKGYSMVRQKVGWGN